MVRGGGPNLGVFVLDFRGFVRGPVRSGSEVRVGVHSPGSIGQVPQGVYWSVYLRFLPAVRLQYFPSIAPDLPLRVILAAPLHRVLREGAFMAVPGWNLTCPMSASDPSDASYSTQPWLNLPGTLLSLAFSMHLGRQPCE